MLETVGYGSLDELVDATIPRSIRLDRPLALGPERSEYELLRELRTMMSRNRVFRSYLGMGYHDCITPPVIQRNVLENPGWYTQYTPYQAEISQGRLEALLNFQTLISDLTGLPMSNASLLDEATAAAEAAHMCVEASERKRLVFWMADDCHPQTIAVTRTRGEPLGVSVQTGSIDQIEAALGGPEGAQIAGVCVQYPSTDGVVRGLRGLIVRAHGAGAKVVVAADPLALTLLVPPGELGADITIGTTQRFGEPMGFGGTRAARR